MYKHKKRLEYVKIFIEIVKPMSYKYFFALEVKHSYWIYHMNVVKNFIYNFFNKIIFMEQSHLFSTKFDKVCKLIKTLYGLKKAPYIWYKTVVKFFKRLRFTQFELDYKIFVLLEK